MSTTKKLNNITAKQISDKGVQALANRPNASAQYGASGLSPTQLKLWFDKLATFIAEKINELQNTISADDAAAYIRLLLDDHGVENLDDLVKSFIDGSFAEKILQVHPSVSEVNKIPLQSVINNVSRDLSEKSEKIDSLGNGLATAQNDIDKLKHDLSMTDDYAAGLAGRIDGAFSRMDSIDSDIENAIGFAGNFVMENINGLHLSYDENTNTMSMQDKNGDDISSVTLAVIDDIKAQLEGLWLSKFSTDGGQITGDVAILGSLFVTGLQYIIDAEHLRVRDCIIETNSDGTTLTTLSGIAIHTGSDTIYGIVYDPASDSVKLGIVTVDENGVYRFAGGEGSPVATRAESADMADGKVVTWNEAKRRMETTSIPAVVDDNPTAGSDNLVSSNGVAEFVNGAYDFAASAGTSNALSYIKDADVLVLSNDFLGHSSAVSLGIQDIEERVSFLTTLLFNTIITNTTVEDTYTSRVTAGGLSVVSNTPTTVHKIAGDTKASENLFDLSIESGTYAGITISSNNNAWTLSGTPTSQFATLKSVTLPSWLGGKTVTISQSKYFANYNEAGSVYLSIVKVSPWTTVATSITESKTVTLEEGATYRLLIMNGNTSDIEEETVSFMANLGETALPYSDYYAGLKNAAFNGIASTGSNIVDIYGKVGEGITKSGVTVTQEQDGYLHFSGIPTGSYRPLFTISQDLFQDGETYTFAQSDYFGTYGSAYRNKNAVYWKVSRRNLATGESISSLISTDALSRSVTFDKTTYFYGIDIVTGSYAYTSGDEMDVSLRFWINRGSTALPYEDYTTDTSFQLSASRSLRKWDYIDVDKQRLVTGTAEVTQDTAFTDEELAAHPDYIISADRKTIAYPLETPTTAALTVPQTYTAWRNGSETVDTGAADALPPTITQTYYEEVTSA